MESQGRCSLDSLALLGLARDLIEGKLLRARHQFIVFEDALLDEQRFQGFESNGGAQNVHGQLVYGVGTAQLAYLRGRMPFGRINLTPCDLFQRCSSG